jgi:hypothetical protein
MSIVENPPGMPIAPLLQQLAKIKKWRFRNLWLTLSIVSAYLIVMTLIREIWMPDFPINCPLYMIGAMPVVIGYLGFLRLRAEKSELKTSIYSLNKLFDELLILDQQIPGNNGNFFEREIPDDFICRHDSAISRLILRNLLINANKFASQDTASIKAYKANTDIVIAIADEGTDRLTKKEWRLGCRLITEMLRLATGKMHIVSKRNRGATVIITLPLRG